MVDILTVHTPLNEQTKNLIGAKEIQMMKKGVRLINCARGGIYDEAALVEGLKSGHLGGVALDVYVDRAVHEQPAVRHAQRALHAAPRRQHGRGPDQRGRRGGRAVDRFLHHRRDQAVGEHVAAGSQDPGEPPRIPERGLPAGPAPGPGRPSLADQLPHELQGRGGEERHAAARRRPLRPGCCPMPCRA